MKLSIFLLLICGAVAGCDTSGITASSKTQECTYNDQKVDCSALDNNGNLKPISHYNKNDFPETVQVSGATTYYVSGDHLSIDHEIHEKSEVNLPGESYSCSLDLPNLINLKFSASADSLTLTNNQTNMEQKVTFQRVKNSPINPANYLEGKFELYSVVNGQRVHVQDFTFLNNEMKVDLFCHPRLE